MRFVIHHVRNLLPVAALREEKRKSWLFIFTVLDQSFSEISFHVRSAVQSSRICRVWVWKVYFTAIDVKFCDQGISMCHLRPVLSNNIKFSPYFFHIQFSHGSSRGKIFMSNFHAFSYSIPILLFLRNENYVKIQVKICKLIEARKLYFIIDLVRHGV